jgi:hypothetical protein
MAENTIEVAITAESINNLRASCQVLKDAFKKQLAQDAIQNEAAVYPFLTPLVYDMKEDIKAAKDSLESYDKLTIEDYDNIVDPDIGNYSDLDNISGNYSLTPDDAKDIKDRVNKLVGKSAQNVTAADSAEVSGGRFAKSSGSESSPAPKPDRPDTGPENVTEIGEDQVSNYSDPPQRPESVFSNSYKGKKKNWLQECVPCFPRPDLGNIRPGEEIYGMLENSFANRYEALIRRWKRLFSDPSVYDDLCSIGDFMNQQCVPDLQGLIALLSLYSAKVADIKFISPQNMFMAMIGPIFAPIFQGLGDLLDQYVQMIVNPVLCVLNSLDKQIAKLDVLTPTDQALQASLATLERRLNSLRRSRERLVERLNELKSAQGRLEDVSPREIATIESDIRRIDEQVPSLRKKRAELREGRDAVASVNVFGDAREKAQEARAGLGKGLKQIRNYTQKGVDYVNGSLETIKKELERLIFGRAASAEDMLQGAEDLQKIARVISLLTGFMEFAQRFLEGDLCKEPGNPLNNLVLASGPTDSGTADGDDQAPTMKYIKTTGENGEPLLLVTSSENVVELEGEDQTREPLEGNGIIEVDSIAGKTVRATSEFGEPAPVAVMPFNLCGKKEGTSASSLAKIKEWAEASNL